MSDLPHGYGLVCELTSGSRAAASTARIQGQLLEPVKAGAAPDPQHGPLCCANQVGGR